MVSFVADLSRLRHLNSRSTKGAAEEGVVDNNSPVKYSLTHIFVVENAFGVQLDTANLHSFEVPFRVVFEVST